MSRKKGRRSKPFALKLKKETLSSIFAVVMVAFGALLSVSFSRQGPVLAQVNLIGSQMFGWTFLLLPFIFISGGLLITKVKWQIARPNVFLGSLIILIALTGLTRAGDIGIQIFDSIAALITTPGTIVFYLASFAIGSLIFFETSIEDIAAFFQEIQTRFSKLQAGVSGKSLKTPSLFPKKDFKVGGMVDKDSDTGIKVNAPPSLSAANFEPTTSTTQVGDQITIWEPPPLSLLTDEKKAKADRGDINKNASIIEKTLESFGIGAHVIEVNMGPAVTQYAIEIASGIKLSKIIGLHNDLALALSAPHGQIRIEAPIPGRNLVGIEIPNHSLEFVSFRQMISSPNMQKSKSKLTVALGLNVAGEPTVADISKMPHVLIAGSTGSGKSVCINAFIASILFRASPSEVKFILVDPKRVELTGYNGIPHLLTPVITDPEKCVDALKWAMAEMESRYKLFQEVGVRNIAAYNEMSGFQAMPYIIIVIDELADIILSNANEVENAITRLAQMARAVGIHLVLATQRPSVDVITGLIKANIPCRISFNVTSMIDSRVIIDSPGAEKLLGRGDMLYIPPDEAKPRRIQGTFVDDAELTRLMNHLKQSGIQPDYNPTVTQHRSEKQVAQSVTGEDIGEVDEQFLEAIRICVDNNKASASLLQRKLSVGYARAARILDQLEIAGVVSAPDHAKAREVLIHNADEIISRLTQGQ